MATVTAKLSENSYGKAVRVRTSSKVRLSFPHLFEKYEKSGKYQAQLLIDPEDKETLAAIEKAVEAAKQDGKDRVWNGKIPTGKNFHEPVHDISDMEAPPDELDDWSYVNAKSSRRPTVLDENKAEIFDDEDIYAGCYVSAILEFYPFSNESKGVACALLGVRKCADGERIGGGGSVASADDWDDDGDEKKGADADGLLD